MEASSANIHTSPLPFLRLIGTLKHLPRTGWLRMIKRPESVAAHMYRLAVLAMFAPDGLNTERCIFLALCHDIAESVVGDIPTYAGITRERKHKLEDFGIRYIQSLLKGADPALGSRIRAAWVEYEDGETSEARFIREMDKFECMLQAHEYERSTFGEKNFEEFQSLSSRVRSPQGTTWLELLQHERQTHFARRAQRLPVVFVIGALGVDIASAIIHQTFGFQDISIEEVLHEKSMDKEYLHAEFLKECLEENIEVPVELLVSLLDEKINIGMNQGRKWSIVRNFPQNMQELHEFEMMVQNTNYTMQVSCSACDVNVVNHLKLAEGYYKEINIGGAEDDVHNSVRTAMEDILQHAELAFNDTRSISVRTNTLH